MRHIYKYPLYGPSGRVGLSLPTGSKILTVQLQKDVVTVWAEVPDDVTRFDNFDFFFLQTGDVLPIWSEKAIVGSLHYLTTLQNSNGIVWHVYQIK